MTKKQALQNFKKNILPNVISQYGNKDIPAKCEAWNNYTDFLCKSQVITSKQYSNWTNPY